MKFKDDEGRPWIGRAAETIPEVNILDELRGPFDLILGTCEFFFKGMLKMNNPPFHGFILTGPPGTGKTEIVKQVARKLDQRLKSVFYGLIDGASVAAPRWGDAERNLRDAFHRIDEMQGGSSGDKRAKAIILFDDIESLMISRGADMAKEWHYAINSILFHELDILDPAEVIVCATSNRPDLVDEAIRTRLYPIDIQPLPVSSLRPVIEEILDASNIDSKSRTMMMEKVIKRLEQMKTPSVREARYTTVAECIASGVWSA